MKHQQNIIDYEINKKINAIFDLTNIITFTYILFVWITLIITIIQDN
jgi:hypothetical protein